MRLFGGAITAAIPSELIDASEIRPVPDNQEVYIGTVQDTDVSLIVELLEAVPEQEMASALSQHVEESHRLAGTDPKYRQSPNEFISTRINKFDVVGRVDTVNSPKGNFSLVFGLIRLYEYRTDVLITCTLSVEPEKHIALQDYDTQKAVVLKLMETFTIKEPSLFGEEVTDMKKKLNKFD